MKVKKDGRESYSKSYGIAWQQVFRRASHDPLPLLFVLIRTARSHPTLDQTELWKHRVLKKLGRMTSEARPEKACDFCPLRNFLQEASCVVKTFQQSHVVVPMVSNHSLLTTASTNLTATQLSHLGSGFSSTM